LCTIIVCRLVQLLPSSAEQAIMYSKWFAPFLILLLLLASTDDVWAAPILSPSTVLGGDYDDYLIVVPQRQPHRSGVSGVPMPHEASTAATSPLAKILISERCCEAKYPARSGADPLYVFMSLQR